MGTPRGQAACNLRLLLDRATASERTAGNIEPYVAPGKRANSLLWRHLRQRDNTEFIARVRECLIKEGVSEQAIAGCLRDLLDAPGASLARKQGGRHDFLHAVAFTDVYGPCLAIVRVRLSPGSPARVDEVGAKVVPFESPWELSEYLEDWWREFGVRQITLPENVPARTVLWVGDPQRCGYLDVPGDWQARLRTTVSVVGMKFQPVVAKEDWRVRRGQLMDSAELAVRLNGWSAGRAMLDGTTLGETALVVGTVGSSFEALHTEVRRSLVEFVLDDAADDAGRARELAPGEVVYHRKTGAGGGSADRFDEGSSKPCGCGKTFVIFHNADKASKGMARRYSNFHDSDVQLKHCPKFPKCGMYAVERKPTR
ncbi:hypothetical protein [Actinomadura flavalba]|uniref:hypothetical protein n=1 Tax=Actinomadura flavalba TaxID=1120938 RepID=UPI000360CEDC|nr:hypothetical protein [Actinomadura flavalba]